MKNGNGTMSKFERRAMEIKAAQAKQKVEVARPVEHLTYTKPQNPTCILLPKMKVFGQFKRIPGLLDQHQKRTVEEVLRILDSAPIGAEFIGQHAGRRVVAQRKRVMATIVFSDSYSSYLPNLPSTKL